MPPISVTSEAECEACVAGYSDNVVMGDKFQMLQRHFRDEYYPNLENKKRINSLPCLLSTVVFLWSASKLKKSVWSGYPDMVASQQLMAP